MAAGRGSPVAFSPRSCFDIFQDMEAGITQIRVNPGISIPCSASYALVWYGQIVEFAGNH
jgi:hypothetical protein